MSFKVDFHGLKFCQLIQASLELSINTWRVGMFSCQQSDLLVVS